MLTKRTNILFDEEMWSRLKTLAKNQKTTVGKLIRNAVKETYLSDKHLRERASAINNIFKKRKKFKKIDYKKLINYGRKY